MRDHGGLSAARVSVVIAAYNEEQYIERAIQSVLQQTFRDFELIVADDGSSDRTLAIIRSFGDGRIRLIVNQGNQGVPRSRNRAMAIAAAPYIAVMDAGDISLPERLQRQISYLDTHREVGLVGSYSYIIDEAGKEIGSARTICESRELAQALSRHNCFTHGSVMFRRSCLDIAGDYREEFKYAHDYDLILRISEHYRVANIPEPLYKWRLSIGGISVKHKLVQDAEAELIRELATQRRARGRDSLQAMSREESGAFARNYIDRYVRKHMNEGRRFHEVDGGYFWGRKLYYEGSYFGARKLLIRSLFSSPFRFPREGWKMLAGAFSPPALRHAVRSLKR